MLWDNLNFVFFQKKERKLHKIQIFGSDLEISIFLHIVNIHSFGRIVQNVNKVIFWSINRRLNLLTKICPLSAEPFQINIFSKKLKFWIFFRRFLGPSISEWHVYQLGSCDLRAPIAFRVSDKISRTKLFQVANISKIFHTSSLNFLENCK